MSASEAFESRADAEAWMGAEWSRLADAGGHEVVLMEDEQVIYRMSLEPG